MANAGASATEPIILGCLPDPGKIQYDDINNTSNSLTIQSVCLAERAALGRRACEPYRAAAGSANHPAFSIKRPLMYLCRILEMNVW